MKKLLGLFLVLSVLFTACNKEKEKVKPVDPADKIAGSYELSSLTYEDGTENSYAYPTLPYTHPESKRTLSASVKFTKVSATNVNMTLVVKVTGAKDSESDFGDLEVREAGSAYGLFFDGARVGDVGADGKDVIFNAQDDTFQFKFVGKK
jgi:hypothetical protein